MKNVEKIFYIMELLNLTANNVASKLEINNSLISHWKSGRNKPKRVHIYAFCFAFNIPVDIFRLYNENEANNFDNPKQIEKYLNKYQNSDKEIEERCERDDNVIKRLSCDELYFYNPFEEISILKIEGNYKVLNLNSRGEIIREGKIEINESQSIIKLKSNQTKIYLYIIFDNKHIRQKNLFYGSFISQNLVSKPTIGMCILSRVQLSQNGFEYIFKNEKRVQIEMDNELEEKILEVGEKPTNFETSIYEKSNVEKSLIGTWYFSIFNDRQEHRFEIDDNLNVKWYIDGRFQEDGILRSSEFQSIIEFTDTREIKSYFIFDNDKGMETKICRFDSRRKKGTKEVMGIGILEKGEKPTSDMLEKILISEEKSILNTFNFKDRLLNSVFSN
jgi:transcriptional regulator with XRE-family HTH domain